MHYKNILIDDMINAKLCDFGISKIIENPNTGETNLEGRFPQFNSPEYAIDGKILKTNDIWSFGALILFMSSG